MINNIFNDGANWQAQAVAAFICSQEIESSWSDENKRYMAEPELHRWHNCREQGYVITLTVYYKRQLNIAFFEHRNSDNICAVVWEQKTMNPPTIDTAKFGDIYKDKYDISFTKGYGEIVETGRWIIDQLSAFYLEAKKEQA